MNPLFHTIFDSYQWQLFLHQRGDSIHIDQDEVWRGLHLHAKIGPDRLRGSTGAPKFNILSKSRGFVPQRQQIPIHANFGEKEYVMGSLSRTKFGADMIGTGERRGFVTTES